MKIYLKRKTLGVKHTCPVWLIYWHSMNCGNLETNLPLFSGIVKLWEWKSTTAMTDIKRDWQEKDNKKRGREKEKSRNSERLGEWNEKEKRRYLSMRERDKALRQKGKHMPWHGYRHPQASSWLPANSTNELTYPSLSLFSLVLPLSITVLTHSQLFLLPF